MRNIQRIIVRANTTDVLFHHIKGYTGRGFHLVRLEDRKGVLIEPRYRFHAVFELPRRKSA